MYAIIAQCTYQEIQVALFHNDSLIHTAVEPKKTSSSNLLLTIDRLLADHTISLSDLTFIGLNRGPAPFTTLRVLITTIDGLAYATGIPLTGTSGLKAILEENKEDRNVVAIYNAYGSECYFAYCSNDNLSEGCKNTQELFADLCNATENITFIGQGTKDFQDEIKSLCPQAIIDTTRIYPSLETVYALCKKEFDAGNTEAQLQPLYLKKAS